MADVFVKMINFHNGKINECVTENEDGSFTVFIEDNLSQEAKQMAYTHALCHINKNHFEKDVNFAEKEAHI